MDFIFADDSRQPRPSRPGIGPLLAIGGLHVPALQVGPLEKALRTHCESVGFPHDEQFKWSPGKKEEFQRAQLKGEKRTQFFRHLIGLATDHGSTATVVIEDSSKGLARVQSNTHEEDVTALFLERCEWCFSGAGRHGVVLLAQPGGGSSDEQKFVSGCLDLIREGTEYVKLESLGLGVLTAPSRQVRLLQLADIVVSATVARVSGESNFSPPVFEAIVPALRSDGTRKGGVGLKIHPDGRYANLYYWLLGDTHWWKGNSGIPLPRSDMPYSQSAEEVSSAP